MDALKKGTNDKIAIYNVILRLAEKVLRHPDFLLETLQDYIAILKTTRKINFDIQNNQFISNSICINVEQKLVFHDLELELELGAYSNKIPE